MRPAHAVFIFVESNKKIQFVCMNCELDELSKEAIKVNWVHKNMKLWTGKKGRIKQTLTVLILLFILPVLLLGQHNGCLSGLCLHSATITASNTTHVIRL